MCRSIVSGVGSVKVREEGRDGTEFGWWSVVTGCAVAASYCACKEDEVEARSGANMEDGDVCHHKI